jgi:hypothetical protein
MVDVHITLDDEVFGQVTVVADTMEEAVTVLEAVTTPTEAQADAVITWLAKDTRKLNEETSIPIDPPKYSPGPNWSDYPYAKTGSNPRRLFPRSYRNTSQIQGIRGTCTHTNLLRLLHVLRTK